MLLKFIVPLCLLAYSASATLSLDLEPIMAQQHHAMHLLVSRYANQPLAAADNEVDFIGCFADYSKEQNGVVDVYEKSYTLCKSTATDARSKLTADSAAKRADLLKRGNGVCSQLSACEQYEDGLDFFQCYNAASTKNYPEVYALSTDSEAEASFLQIQYYQIGNDEEACATTAKNTYVASMAKCNGNFNDCLNGKSSPTTVSPSEPSTDEPSVTDAPVEPTTEEPIVTDAPVDPTTEDPIATDTPVEPTTEEPIVTDAPVDPTTEEPIATDAPIEATTEDHIEPNKDILPEEDLQLAKHKSRLHLWNKLRHF